VSSLFSCSCLRLKLNGHFLPVVKNSATCISSPLVQIIKKFWQAGVVVHEFFVQTPSTFLSSSNVFPYIGVTSMLVRFICFARCLFIYVYPNLTKLTNFVPNLSFWNVWPDDSFLFEFHNYLLCWMIQF
jgi:hypothetical protein